VGKEEEGVVRFWLCCAITFVALDDAFRTCIAHNTDYMFNHGLISSPSSVITLLSQQVAVISLLAVAFFSLSRPGGLQTCKISHTLSLHTAKAPRLYFGQRS
jgi:hypothetical protein